MKWLWGIAWVVVPFVAVVLAWRRLRTLFKIGGVWWGAMMAVLWVGFIAASVNPQATAPPEPPPHAARPVAALAPAPQLSASEKRSLAVWLTKPSEVQSWIADDTLAYQSGWRSEDGAQVPVRLPTVQALHGRDIAAVVIVPIAATARARGYEVDYREPDMVPPYPHHKWVVPPPAAVNEGWGKQRPVVVAVLGSVNALPGCGASAGDAKVGPGRKAVLTTRAISKDDSWACAVWTQGNLHYEVKYQDLIPYAFEGRGKGDVEAVRTLAESVAGAVSYHSAIVSATPKPALKPKPKPHPKHASAAAQAIADYINGGNMLDFTETANTTRGLLKLVEPYARTYISTATPTVLIDKVKKGVGIQASGYHGFGLAAPPTALASLDAQLRSNALDQLDVAADLPNDMRDGVYTVDTVKSDIASLKLDLATEQRLHHEVIAALTAAGGAVKAITAADPQSAQPAGRATLTALLKRTSGVATDAFLAIGDPVSLDPGVTRKFWNAWNPWSSAIDKFHVSAMQHSLYVAYWNINTASACLLDGVDDAIQHPNSQAATRLGHQDVT